MVAQNPHNWVYWLPLAELWYNTHFHTGLKVTPFEMLYGYKPPHLNFHQFGKVYDPITKQFCQDRAQLLRLMKQHLTEAQARIKHYADKHRTERVFVSGDMVYLKVRPYKQLSLSALNQGKLLPKYYGPFLVESKVGAVAYKLQLPTYAKVHPVFHFFSSPFFCQEQPLVPP